MTDSEEKIDQGQDNLLLEDVIIILPGAWLSLA